MTARAAPLFTAYTSTTVAHVALCSLTVTRATIVFTDARCSNCNRRLMSIPGTPLIEVRSVATDADRSGRGRCLACPRCKQLCEVIER